MFVDPNINAICSYVYYNLVSCEYSYFSYYNLTIKFSYPSINLTEFMDFNGKITNKILNLNSNIHFIFIKYI